MEGKVYVGDIGADATSEEITEKFEKYGRLREVWVARNPPGFAFVMFEDPRDADDAVRALDGTHMCGMRARVEHARARNPSRGAPSRYSGRPPRDMVISSKMRGHPRDYGDRDDRDSRRRYRDSPPRRRRSYSRSPRRRRYSPSPPRSSSRRY